MARVKIEDIVEQLDGELGRALEDAVKKEIPEIGNVNRRRLMRRFVRAVGRRCSTWERVPDRMVECD